MRARPEGSAAGSPSPRSRRRTPRRRTRPALCIGLVALGALGFAAPGRAAPEPIPAPASPATGADAVFAGRPLAEVLRGLQDDGLEIVFTTELVRPGMEVVAEPASDEPRRILDEILAPHGLEVREGPGGVLVVARAREPEAPAPGAEERPTGGDVVQDVGLSEEILVRPSRLSLLREDPDAPFAFSREEIEALPRLGGDVLRPLALLPGTAANDVTARFSVHGGRRDEVKILLDGQELYDAFHLEDYDSALSIVPAQSLASASLSTGAFPASQGDRMSGVLDLRTPDPPAERHVTLGLSVLDALVSSSGPFAGPWGSREGGRPEARGGWLVTARRGSLDLAGRAIGDEDPAFWDVLGKVELDTGLGRVSAHVLTAADELELDRTEEEGFERLENDYRTTYAWLRHQAAAGDRLLVETVGSWAAIRRDRSSTTRDEEASFTLRDRRNLEVFALSQSWSLHLGGRGPDRDSNRRRAGHSLDWGWEARHYDASFDYVKDLRPVFVLAPPDDPAVTRPPSRTRFDRPVRGEHYGLWVSDRFTVLERLTAELGVRFDHHTATGEDLLSPRVNLAWRLDDRSVARAAWGRFHQSQRPYELAVEDGETALREAELSEHWVLGYERRFGSEASAPFGLDALRVELFRREIDDPRPRSENLLEPINFFQEIEPDRVRIAPERSTAEGIEILIRARPHESFAWWLASSYARAEDRLDGRTVPRALDQPNAVTLGLDFRLPARWRLNLAWRYHTGWPTTSVESSLVADPDDPEAETELTAAFGPLYGERLPDYHRLDARASRQWKLGRGALTFFVDVQNVYHHRNLAGFDVSVDEDEGVVELEEEHWPGIFPSIGILWEW